MYPDAYLADCAAAKEKSNILGNISYAEVTRNNKLFTIVNIYGQNLHGQHKDAEGLHRKTSYEAIYCGLVRMRELVDFLYPNQNKTIGFPKRMGSDRGGASWEIIERMIEVVFDGYIGEVVIVDYVPPVIQKTEPVLPSAQAKYFADDFEQYFRN